MSANEPTGEWTFDENDLISELMNKMSELEDRYRQSFSDTPLHKTLSEIVNSVSDEQHIDSMKLWAIFTDFAEAFLEKAVEANKTLDQNVKLNNELFKANDLIRRLTDENEYHLNKIKGLAKQLDIYKESWRGKLTEKSVERQISEIIEQKDSHIEELRNKLADTEKEFMKLRVDSTNNKSPSKLYIDDDSKNFTELKGSEIKDNSLRRSINIDKIYDDLIQMDHKQLVEHCLELKQKLQTNRSKSTDKPRPSSALRSSQNCCVYKSLTQTEKATENLEKKYKRIRQIANELSNKNTVYQNDVFKAEKRIESMESRFNSLVEDFQKYINSKENEIAEKDRKLNDLANKNDQDSKDEHYIPLQIDADDRNFALKVYSEIMEDFTIPQERDEVMLDTIEKYIYDKKQPNVAYILWEAADFHHWNNIEKSCKLMKALLQDCYLPGKKPESEFIEK